MATVALLFPFLSLRSRRLQKLRWSRQLLEVLGVSCNIAGTPPGSGLVAANHVSWLDIYAINAMTPTNFVSKDDVREWPLIGWLSAHTETIFMERHSRSAAMRTKEHLAEALRLNDCITVFPEGTTTNGDTVLPFHSALFQSAIDAEAQLVPAALCYTCGDGMRSQAAAYAGDTSLWESLRSIVTATKLTVHIHFLPPVEATGQDRRNLACLTHRLIVRRLEHPESIVTMESSSAPSNVTGLSPA